MIRVPIRIAHGQLVTKIPLVIGEEYFFNLNRAATLGEFVEQIKAEEEVDIQAENSLMETDLLSLADSQKLNLKINGKSYQFYHEAITEWEYSEQPAFDFASLMLQHKPTDKTAFRSAVMSSILVFSQQVHIQLNNLRLELNEIEIELEPLLAARDRIEKWTKIKSNMLALGGLGVVMANWGAFYYAIYEVEWLGWDLMEPITWTVERSIFLMSLTYYMVNKAEDRYDLLLQRYESKSMIKGSNKIGLNLGRIKVLLERKETLESQIESLQKLLK